MERVAALVALMVLAAACLGRPSTEQRRPTPDPGDELSDLNAEERPPWKGSATVKLTGALRLDLIFTFVDANSRRGPGLVDLNFDSEPYSLYLSGETGNPASKANPMVLLLSNEEFDTISGQAPQCVFNFAQPGPAAIVGDITCTGLVNAFSDAGGAVDLVAAISIGPNG